MTGPASEITAGLGFGLVALVAGVAVGGLWLRRVDRPAPVGGLLFAGATTAGLAATLGAPGGLVWGLASLAAAGLVCDRFGLPLWVAAAAAIPGAWMVSTHGGLAEGTALRASTAIAIVVGGGLVADFDRRHEDRGWSLLLLAISAAGVYMTVPDTEQALVLLGASVALVPLAWPVPLASLGTGGAFAVLGAFSWTVAAGGSPRPSSIVGGLGCLGLLVAEPVAHLLRGRRSPPGRRRWPQTVVVVVAQGVVVAFASRVVGMASLAVAIALMTAELVVLLAVLLGIQRRGQERRR